MSSPVIRNEACHARIPLTHLRVPSQNISLMRLAREEALNVIKFDPALDLTQVVVCQPQIEKVSSELKSVLAVQVRDVISNFSCAPGSAKAGCAAVAQGEIVQTANLDVRHSEVCGI